VRLDPGNDAKIQAQRDAVAQLALDAAYRDQLQACVDELTQQIAAQRRRASPSLDQALRAAAAPLDRADALANDGKLTDLQRVVDEARRAVVDACLAELTRITTGARPPGLTDGSWQETARMLRTQIEGAQREERWDRRYGALQTTQRTFFSAAIPGVIAEARQRADAGDSRAGKLRALADDLAAALARDFDEAAARYPAALAFVTAPDPEGASRGEVGFDGSEAVAASGWLPLVISRVAERGERSPLATTEQIDRAITSYGFLVDVAVLAIAVASGVKALWIDNLAWGGQAAWLTAALWGAGVQATGSAFTGLIGLRAKLGAPSAT
jgi:hypothetical protein